MQDFFLTKYMLIYDQDLLLPLQVLQNNGSKTSALTSYTATLPMIQPMKTFSWVGMTYRIKAFDGSLGHFGIGFRNLMIRSCIPIASNQTNCAVSIRNTSEL